jgi:thioredoxin 1
VNLSDEGFEQFLASEAPNVCLIDFWADWCAPCHALKPIIEEIANERADTLRIGAVEVTECPATSAKYGVISVPTLAIFRDGVLVRRIVGARSKRRLLREIDDVLAG